MRILLVEDDLILGQAIKDGLHEFDYTVDWHTDGESARFALQQELFDLILLDLGLPKMLGTDLLRFIRSTGLTLPVIIVTAREDTDDKIEMLNCGADDFLTKPFEFDELRARIRACHRRAMGRTITKFQINNIVLYPAAHKVTVDNQIVVLLRREFVLLQKLLENKGQIVKREQLMQTLYGWDALIDSNALEVHIHQLRKKLCTGCIRTIRGVGYMIEEEKPKT